MKLTMKQFYVRALREQREWIDEHGATLVGYMVVRPFMQLTVQS
jgi:hypothetical protein